MPNRGKIAAGIGLALVGLVLLAAFTLSAPASGQIAQAAAQATPVPTEVKGTEAGKPEQASKPDKPGAVAADEYEQYLKSFSKDLAGRLGVSEDKLNSAVAASIGSTADQLVKDGKLDPQVAAKAKDATKDGFNGLLMIMKLAGSKLAPAQAGPDELTNPKALLVSALDEVAVLLHTTSKDLLDKVQQGQSLPELAQSAGVDPAKIRETLLNSMKTRLDSAVSSGKMTRAQADDAFKIVPGFIDQFLNNRSNSLDRLFNRLQGDAYWQAAASTLNLTVDGLKVKMQGDRSLQDIAREQQVDVQKLKDALLNSMKQQLADFVKSGDITQAQADEAAKILPALVDKMTGGKQVSK